MSICLITSPETWGQVQQDFASHGGGQEYSVHMPSLTPALHRTRARINHHGFEEDLFQYKDLWLANRNITKISNTVSFWVWTTKIYLEKEKNKRTACFFSYEQKQTLQATLMVKGPKPDQLHSYEVCDIVSLQKSSWNRAPAFLFLPHHSPKQSYPFQ